MLLCGKVDRNYAHSSGRLRVGAFAFLPPQHPARKRAAKLIPQLQHAQLTENDKRVYIRHSKDAPQPADKTDQQKVL